MDRTISGPDDDGKAPDPGQVEALARALLRTGALLGTRLFADLDLHDTDRVALRVLDELAAGPAPVTNALLASRLGRSPSATVALVDRLVTAGLVQRHRDGDDRRRIRITLTDRARAAGGAHLRPYAQRIARAAAELDPAGRRAVARFLTDVLGEPG